MAESYQKFKILQRLKSRLITFVIITVVILIILIFRLVELQIINGAKYYEISQRVIRKIVALPAPRGEMFDRNYTSRKNANYIVSNSATLNLVAYASHFAKNELKERVLRLEEKLRLPKNSLFSKLTKTKIRKNEEIVLIENLNQNQLTVIGDYYLDFSNFIIRQSTGRRYNLGEAASHLTGYIGRPNKRDIKKGIKSYQSVGKNGLESYYDNILRGEDGEIVQIKTAKGDIEEQRVLKNFLPGNNLILTIDNRLQIAAFKGLGDKKGGVIAIKPDSGEVVVMASTPGYNPNILSSPDRKRRNKHLRKIYKNKSELNRVISAKYPAASTFKPLVALAGLEEKRFTPDQVFNCPGKFTLKSTYKGFPDSVYYCWRRHNKNNLLNAIAQSCSVYFYQLGYKIGAEPIIKYARYFKLDQITGIDLPAEIAGFVPSPLWKEKHFNQKWYDGDTVNLSIGQGFIETTLIALTNFYAAIASGGIVYKPHLVKEIRYAENDKIKIKIKPEILYELPISKKNMAVIREGIRSVTTKGTTRGVLKGHGLIDIAGKTGTVQTRSNERHNSKTQHAWYIGYGPFKGALKDKLVVGVFVEKGIGGSVGAAPIARRVFKLWTNKLKKQGLLKKRNK